MSDKKRKGNVPLAPPDPIPSKTIEEQYAVYQKALSEFYKANKTKYLDGLYAKLVKANIFDPAVQTPKDVPWQLVKLMCKRDFDEREE